MVELKDLQTEDKPTWCPGCGDFGIWVSLKNAVVQLGIEPHEIRLISGIGCSSKIPYWIKVNGFNGLHGRPLPVATGIKLANNKLNLVVCGGDGDGYSEGTNHFIHTMRRNMDITYIVHNNQVYGLTTGQTSPTTEKGIQTKSTPEGVIEFPLNPIALALASDATFVARGFSGDVPQLQHLIMEGIKHRGFALIDVLQPCVTFNRLNTYHYFFERVYKLEDEGHNPEDRKAAWAKSLEWGDRIPTGIFYRTSSPTYGDQVSEIKKAPLVKQPIDKIDITSAMKEFV